MNISQKFIQTIKSSLNIDCIKVSPINKNLFAFAYYQQHPQFVGGIAVKQIQSSPIDFQSISIFQCGPILHIVWINHKSIENDQQKYYLVAACRTDKIFIASYTKSTKQQQSKKGKIQILKQYEIQKGMFCLYVDCTLIQKKLNVCVSSNQSKVFHLQINFQSLEILKQYLYSKHQYAVWACRFSQKRDILACGDEVNCLYFYDPINNTLLMKNNKVHKQGICDIVFKDENLMYSSGFDGIVALFDKRKLDQCVKIDKYKGVIWRVIPHQNLQHILLCNSSQNKFLLSKNGKIEWDSKDNHGSLAYAAEWNDKKLITASFYDKVICQWEIN